MTQPNAPLVLDLDAKQAGNKCRACAAAAATLPPRQCPCCPPSCCQRQAGGRQQTPGLCRHRDSYNATCCHCLSCFPSCRQRQAGRRRTLGLRRRRSTMPPSCPDKGEGPLVHSHDSSPKLLTRSSVTAPSPPFDSVRHSPSSVGACLLALSRQSGQYVAARLAACAAR